MADQMRTGPHDDCDNPDTHYDRIGCWSRGLSNQDVRRYITGTPHNVLSFAIAREYTRADPANEGYRPSGDALAGALLDALWDAGYEVKERRND